MRPIPLIQQRFELGEGPLYHEKALYWVDILDAKLHCWQKGNLSSLSIPSPFLSSVVAINQSDLLISGKDRLFVVSDLQRIHLLTLSFGLHDNCRFNDAKVDPWGNYWIGSMDLDFNLPKGALYCVNPQGQIHVMLENLICSNGLAFDQEKSLVYHTDSKTQNVYAYRFDPANMTLSQPTCLYTETRNGVYPDGMCIDQEGKIYLALWGAGEILQLDPRRSKVTNSWSLPCPEVSSCCFFGPKLDQLLVTSSKAGRDSNAYPDAGKVFQLDLGIRGCPSQNFTSAQPWYKGVSL